MMSEYLWKISEAWYGTAPRTDRDAIRSRL